MPSPPVILWDIDGTLVRTHGRRVAVTAFLDALHLVAQLDTAFPYPTDAGGKTDEQLALEVLLAADVDAQQAADLLPAFRQAYLDHLERDRVALTADLRVLPGVPDLLATLQARGIVQSLLTGNLEPIAHLKLACAGLDHFVDFSLGAFGSDHRERTSLVPITRERLRTRYGDPVADGPLIVIGDTPRDIACARAGNALAVAVATGSFPRDALAPHAPDLLLDDLHDSDHVVAALLALATELQ
jgi:phosphoglycolate phosphatase-like HAD superfamily hydrolase